MKKLISLAFILGSLATVTKAQSPSATAVCSESKKQSLTKAKVSVADPAEDHYDMKHVKLNLALDNTSTYLSGDVTTTAEVVVSMMSDYVFELDPVYLIDSVKVNGQLLGVSSSGDVRTVALPAALPMNTVFSAQVYYRGQLPSGPGFFAGGIRTDASPSWGADVTFTLSQPYAAKEWWPTKQSLTDKIDSADIWLTVPSHLKAGSNGLLLQTTPVAGNKIRFEWKTKYPIDYYLISAAVAPYTDYSFKVGFPGSNDSVLYQNFVYNNPQTLPFWKDEIDSVAGMLIYFSELFGRYPFWQEKYGHCMVPLSGGMEHQTMTSQGYFTTTLSAHELAHQWFGDNVTCGSWSDVWLNEGFASYGEYLYVHHFRGASDGFDYMAGMHDEVMQQPDGSVYVDDTTSVSRIFDSRLSYKKGAAILHTLRFIIDNDSLCFQVLRYYQQQFGGGTALVSDFKLLAEQVSGRNLDTFFNQWYYGEGFPLYLAQWNQVGSQVYVELTQNTTAPPSIPFFYTPLELKFHTAAGDTIVKVYHSQSVQTFSFTWNKPMTQLEIDPNNWILNFTLGVSKDVNLSMEPSVATQEIIVFPNPANTHWQIVQLPEGAELQVIEMSGKTVWAGVFSGAARIDASRFASGVYFLRVNSDKKTATFKLIKQ